MNQNIPLTRYSPTPKNSVPLYDTIISNFQRKEILQLEKKHFPS